MCTQETDRVFGLSQALKCHPAVAAVLINRGLEDREQARAFLHPTLGRIRSPFLMKDMDKAVARIIRAIRQGERIFVFGDYDVDGMTATAVLLDFFSHLDIDVFHHIPDRLTEGYGLTPEAVSTHALPHGTNLIITVDCGVTSHEAIRLANQSGMDVIVTDHHHAPSPLPDALAILNPKRPDCPSRFENLAGVGVAFSLVVALRKALRDLDYWKDRGEPNLKNACDLVALGTVADMVPLLEENRIYVKTGLDVLLSRPRPGLKALLHVSKATGRPVDTWDLAFRLAPRLNAAGRLGHSATACDLLTTCDDDAAALLSQTLDEQNNTRKGIEKEVLDDIDRQLTANPQWIRRSLVLESPSWHEGVIGIVASRLVSRYTRPVVLIAVQNGLGKGSARAPEGFHLFQALQACAGHLERFGGHEAAAGLCVKADNIARFRKAFDAFVCDHSNPQDFLHALHIDAHLAPGDISPGLLDDIERLAPFGSGNPEPLFMISNLDVVSAQPIGDHHMKMRLLPAADTVSKPWDAIFFHTDFGAGVPKRFRNIACHLRWNRWQNTKRLQLVVKDAVPA